MPLPSFYIMQNISKGKNALTDLVVVDGEKVAESENEGNGGPLVFERES